ncbi:MAG: peptidoglycan-associated lipoprotein Pal [Burkholderiales bacterium]
MNIAKTTALMVAAGILCAACSSTPPKQPETATAPKTTPPAVVSKPETRPVAMPVAIPAYLDPNSAISTKRSVYFDFDNYTVKKDFSPLIELQGKYLASNPSVAVKIAGNADERGSSEYNLALGQRRAEAVRRALAIYGAKDAQMEAISFGKEKPKASGHDEAAWAQNRRADIQYPTK